MSRRSGSISCIFLPLTLLVCLGLLRPLKGLLIASQYKNKAAPGRLDAPMSRRRLAAAAAASADRRRAALSASASGSCSAWPGRKALIAAADTRAHAAPAACRRPRNGRRSSPPITNTAASRRTGVYDYAHQELVFGALEEPRGRYGGVGYYVMTPLQARRAARPSSSTAASCPMR